MNSIIHKYDRVMESYKWAARIPFIRWEPDWFVRAIPPFCGATVRYNIRRPDSKNDRFVSVYLDCYDNLGCYGEPYWEVHPYDDGVIRCDMNDCTSLRKYIQHSLDLIAQGD